jgi:hypothetical protein
MMIDLPKTHLPRGFDERQKAMDEMIKVLKENEICAACAGSAALYVAAQAAMGGMNVELPEFLQMAETIFKDAAQQMQGRDLDN